ncbi:hypothetical protein SAMN06265365_107204 [Tistlia consotensis]|uniref:Uncharacterized protein n=1 Tax=Tistlia consotensis USBA 355 TaxID=560819 RepID=A0A1Y6BDU4_9PROT|nr:hypothetical protein [Tistlia consotensis]SME98775.1 hypothetical protein SAMN05428998_102206 [Tistlia consotensis USBA 355]SNR58174.1 hypothetical protein SAMN06265365_107204 [Tistlia consotensis]
MARPLSALPPADRSSLGLAFLAGLAALAVNLGLLDLVRRGVEFELSLQLAGILYTLANMAGALAIAVRVGDPLRRLLLLAGWFLFATAVFPSLGFLGPLGALPAAAIGLAAAVLSWRAGLPRPVAPWAVALLLVAVLGLGLLSVAGYQAVEQQTHFFLPEFARLGILHKDPLTFLSLAALIRNGSLPGAVLDGVQHVPYHFGVHYFFVGLAELTGVTTAKAFVVGQQLTAIPLLLFYAALATAELLRLRGEPAPLALPLAVGLVMALPGLVWLVAYYSESSTVSAPLLFLALPLVAAWRPEAVQRPWTAVAGVFLIALVSIVLKVTTALMLLQLAVYLLLSLFLRPSRAAAAFVGLGLLAVLLAAAVWPRLAGVPLTVDFRQAPGFGALGNEIDWAASLVAAATLLHLLRRLVAGAGAGFAGAGRGGGLAALWLLFCAAPFGMVAIGNLQLVTNARYLFNDVILVSGLVMATDAAGLIAWALRGRSARLMQAAYAGLAVLLLGLFLATLEHGRMPPSEAVARTDALVERICAQPGVACPADSRFLTRRLSAESERTIAEATGGRLIEVARELVARGAQAFFVPPSAADVWDFLLHFKPRPIENLQFLPAMTGRPMLLGLPPAARGIPLTMVRGALLGDYGDANRSREINDAALCRHALERRIDTVGIIDRLTPSPRTRLLRCGSGELSGPAEGTDSTRG